MKHLKKLKRYAIILSFVMILVTTPAGCSGRTEDYHQSNDEKWLIEQVEKGYLTQEQADVIREQQKNPK
jgi:hypothetical protein